MNNNQFEIRYKVQQVKCNLIQAENIEPVDQDKLEKYQIFKMTIKKKFQLAAQKVMIRLKANKILQQLKLLKLKFKEYLNI